MREETIEYVHVPPESTLPSLPKRACRIVVVLDQKVSETWQAAVSQWIVDLGCLYMMAWGPSCSSWDDSVDDAVISEFPNTDTPDDRFIMTTWHEEDTLEEVFGFCHFAAFHPTIDLASVVILHIAQEDRRDFMIKSYEAGIANWGNEFEEPSQNS